MFGQRKIFVGFKGGENIDVFDCFEFGRSGVKKKQLSK
jgi:hypothetical protein